MSIENDFGFNQSEHPKENVIPEGSLAPLPSPLESGDFYKLTNEQSVKDAADIAAIRESLATLDTDTSQEQETNPATSNEKSLTPEVASYVEEFNQSIARLEAQQGKVFGMREKIHLLNKGIITNDLIASKVREAILKPEDYIDIPNAHGEEHERITWYDFDEDDTGKYVYLYRGLGSRTYGAEHLSHSGSRGKSESEVLDKFGTDKIANMYTSTAINAAWSEGDPVLHTARSKQEAERFFTNRDTGGALITYKVPKEWILEHKGDVAVGHYGETEVDIWYGLPKEFIDKIEHNPDGETLYLEPDSNRRSSDAPITPVTDIEPDQGINMP